MFGIANRLLNAVIIRLTYKPMGIFIISHAIAVAIIRIQIFAANITDSAPYSRMQTRVAAARAGAVSPGPVVRFLIQLFTADTPLPMMRFVMILRLWRMLMSVHRLSTGVANAALRAAMAAGKTANGANSGCAIPTMHFMVLGISANGAHPIMPAIHVVSPLVVMVVYFSEVLSADVAGSHRLAVVAAVPSADFTYSVNPCMILCAPSLITVPAFMPVLGFVKVKIPTVAVRVLAQILSASFTDSDLLPHM